MHQVLFKLNVHPLTTSQFILSLLSCAAYQTCVLRGESASDPVPVRSQLDCRWLYRTLQVQTKEIPNHHHNADHHPTASHYQANT